MSFVVGLDLGQSQDYTAIAVVEAPLSSGGLPAAALHVRHLERLPLGTSYPSVARRVADLMSTPPLTADTPLIVDATGVGMPVVEMISEYDLSPIPLMITGGAAPTCDPTGILRVPKRDLVSVVLVPLQGGTLKFAAGLPELDTLVKELLAFKVKIDVKTAHDTYGAWREGTHDDLVLATAIACWFAVHCVSGGGTEEVRNEKRREGLYDEYRNVNRQRIIGAMR